MADDPARATPTPALAPRVAPPEPVAVDARRVMAVGTGLWLLAFVVLLPFYSTLGRHGHRVWLWTCLAGSILGLIGYAIMSRHRHQGRTI